MICSSPAPALARGIDLLRHLTAHPNSSLEQIASVIPYPKPSIFRLLQTLLQAGVVEKTDNLRYRPLQVLRPLAEQALSFEEKLVQCMHLLVGETASTVEWWEPGEGGMILRRQIHPEAEVRVQARPGFVRPWDGEMDSVATIGYAFYPAAPCIKAARAYQSNGISGPLTQKQARAWVEAAAQSRTATDNAFNTVGIRRSAAPIHAPEFHGVLAVAIGFRFDGTPSREALERLLCRAAESFGS